jgi:single-stranded DNA-specific DHH superfamily exonuclease
MSRLRIEHGASKVNLVLLKTNIEDTIAEDIDRMAEWSNNERRYIVNELLRFAIAQAEDFQQYKASSAANAARPVSSQKGLLGLGKPASDPSPKPEAVASGAASHA